MNSGDKGSRQELTVKVLNYIHDFVVEDCVACAFLGDPEDPPPPPPPASTPPTMGGGRLTPTTLAGPTLNKQESAFHDPNPPRDVDGDGYADGLVFGPLKPYYPGGWCGTPYLVGVGHRGSNTALGYQSVERWSIGDYEEGDRPTGALVDPWRELDGTTALVVVKNIETGSCTLQIVSRGSSVGTFSEFWPDRPSAVPCTKFNATTLQSLSLSSLLEEEYVAGGFIAEQEIEESICPVLHIQVARDQEGDLGTEEHIRGVVVFARYVVSLDGEGDLVLTEITPQ